MLNKNPSHIVALTMLRFPLAVWVVLFHRTNDDLEFLHGTIPYNILRTGYVPVGIFFALSGFILTHSYRNIRQWRREQLLRFSTSRIARIYPIFAISLILAIPNAIETSSSTATGLGKAALVATLTQSWLPQTALFWNGPAWSLSNEIFFYSIFPFALPLLTNSITAKKSIFLLTIVWIITQLPAILGIALDINFIRHNFANTAHIGAPANLMNFLKFNPIIRLPEFIAGILTYNVYSSPKAHLFLQRNNKTALFIAIAASLLVLSKSGFIPYISLHNGLLMPLYLLLILALATRKPASTENIIIKSLIKLGSASYVLYITHAPLYHIISTFEIFQNLPQIAKTILYTTLAILLSLVLFYTIEKPANKLIRKHFNPR